VTIVLEILQNKFRSYNFHSQLQEINKGQRNRIFFDKCTYKISNKLIFELIINDFEKMSKISNLLYFEAQMRCKAYIKCSLADRLNAPSFIR